MKRGRRRPGPGATDVRRVWRTVPRLRVSWTLAHHCLDGGGRRHDWRPIPKICPGVLARRFSPATSLSPTTYAVTKWPESKKLLKRWGHISAISHRILPIKIPSKTCLPNSTRCFAKPLHGPSTRPGMKSARCLTASHPTNALPTSRRQAR